MKKKYKNIIWGLLITIAIGTGTTLVVKATSNGYRGYEIDISSKTPRLVNYLDSLGQKFTIQNAMAIDEWDQSITLNSMSIATHDVFIPTKTQASFYSFLANTHERYTMNGINACSTTAETCKFGTVTNTNSYYGACGAGVCLSSQKPLIKSRDCSYPAGTNSCPGVVVSCKRFIDCQGIQQ